MRRILVLPALAVMAVVAVPVRAVSVEQIPSPRPAGWTVDLTRTLSPGAVQVLDHIGDEVKAQVGAELAVVVVGSTDGVPPREFATRLFNHWQIGDREASNGVLLFAALDDHKAELILGSGIDTEETRRISEEIMQVHMVPRFREGDPGGALIHGADAAARRLLHAAPSLLTESLPATPAEVSPPVPAPLPRRLVPSSAATPADKGWLWLLMAGLVGSGSWACFRLLPPRCPECRVRMAKLDESQAELYLEPSEQIENRIGSMAHRIWTCRQCGTFKKVSYRRIPSGYRRCPGCGARTKSRVSVTLAEATEASTGLLRITEACAACDYRTSEDRVTPMIVASAGSFHSDSSSASDGSSGSSGGDFGGGHSSGGGSSGSW